MRRKKEDAETTRLNLLRAAGNVFSEKGFEATRLSDIAIEANVTRGAIYWHFGNKGKLFEELIKEKIRPFIDLLDEVVAENLSPLEKIRAFLARTAINLESNDDFKISQRLDFIITGMMGRDDTIRKYLDRETTRVKSAFTRVVIEGQARGEIDDTLDANDIISHLAVFLRGLTFALVLNPDLLDVRDRIDQLVEIEINAISRK